jgi:D-glycero-D-manno-heptose 1,7-bisphosphate phosphatase
MPARDPASRFALARFVFLDRDGVINRKLPEGSYVTCWEDFEMLRGAPEAIASLNRSGRKVVVITNQRGIALGRMNESDLRALHDRMRAELATMGARIDAVYYCPHDRGVCQCRKPMTGMIETAFQDFPGATSENSVVIGDSLSDIECGRNAGMGTIFIDTPEEHPREMEIRREALESARRLADACSSSLADAVQVYFEGS